VRSLGGRLGGRSHPRGGEGEDNGMTTGGEGEFLDEVIGGDESGVIA